MNYTDVPIVFLQLCPSHTARRDKPGPNLGKSNLSLLKLRSVTPPCPIRKGSVLPLHLSWGRQAVEGGPKSEPRAVSSECLWGRALGKEQPLQMPKVKSITRALE